MGRDAPGGVSDDLRRISPDRRRRRDARPHAEARRTDAEEGPRAVGARPRSARRRGFLDRRRRPAGAGRRRRGRRRSRTGRAPRRREHGDTPSARRPREPPRVGSRRAAHRRRRHPPDEPARRGHRHRDAAAACGRPSRPGRRHREDHPVRRAAAPARWVPRDRRRRPADRRRRIEALPRGADPDRTARHERLDFRGDREGHARAGRGPRRPARARAARPHAATPSNPCCTRRSRPVANS